MDMAWLWGLAGGLLIGTASAMHLLLNGRIAGLSGMIRAMVSPSADSGAMLSLVFLLGAFGAALAVSALWFLPAVQVTQSITALVVSGLLVGVGVSLAGGCTSGHGVSGLSRLSPRSLVAVGTFMVFTAVTVFALRLVTGGLL